MACSVGTTPRRRGRSINTHTGSTDRRSDVERPRVAAHKQPSFSTECRQFRERGNRCQMPVAATLRNDIDGHFSLRSVPKDNRRNSMLGPQVTDNSRKPVSTPKFRRPSGPHVDHRKILRLADTGVDKINNRFGPRIFRQIEDRLSRQFHPKGFEQLQRSVHEVVARGMDPPICEPGSQFPSFRRSETNATLRSAHQAQKRTFRQRLRIDRDVKSPLSEGPTNLNDRRE